MADTNLPTFAQGTMPSFTPPAEDRDSASSLLRETLGDQFSGIGNLMDRKAKADEKAMRLEQEQKQTELKKKAEAYGTYAEGIKSQYEQAKPALMAAPPKFNVTKDTQEGLTGLAALMTVGSLIIGSKGAASGVNAMNAMTGVLKGYQEGNQARIDFETKKYEQSVKDWERTLQQTKDALSRYEKMASLDLNKATAEAAAYAASQGQDVIAAKIRSGTIGDAIKMVQNLQQQTANAKTQWATINGQTGLYSPAEIRAAMEGGATVTQVPKATSAGQNAQMYAGRVYGNIEGASQDLINIANSPSISQSPVFAGIINSDPTTALGSVRALALRTITPDEQRAFDQLSQQVGLALSRLEAQGLASGSTQSQVKGFDALRPKAGDSAVNMALYLAKVRQEIETGIKVHATMAGANPEQKKNAQARLKEVQDAIPFTVSEVLAVLKDNKETLSDSSKKLLSQPGIATGLQMEGGQTTTQQKPQPTQSDIDYARANPQVRDLFIQRFGREP